MSGLLESLPQSREALGILTRTPARRSPGENREYVRALLPLLAEARRKGHGFVKIAETLGRHGVLISRCVLERHYKALTEEAKMGGPETPQEAGSLEEAAPEPKKETTAEVSTLPQERGAEEQAQPEDLYGFIVGESYRLHVTKKDGTVRTLVAQYEGFWNGQYSFTYQHHTGLRDWTVTPAAMRHYEITRI